MGEIPIIGGQQPTGPSGAIFRVRSPLQEVGWEYHPQTKKLYVVRNATPDQGELVAENIPDADTAVIAIQCWVRGWKERDRILRPPPVPQ